MSGFEGKCAPFLYVAQCPPKQRDAYILASRIWIAPNIIGLIALLITFIRRVYIVEERFNTLRLLLIKFMLGIPLHIIFDILRALSPTAFGAPLAITSLLWVIGWVPVIGGMILLVITWMSFSSKNLLARPAVTGSWPLYLSLMIPYVLTSLVGAGVSGIDYKTYFIAMRATLASWSAMFLMLFAASFWYGRKTLIRLELTGDNFAKNQQLRAYLIVGAILLSVGIALGVNAFFMDSIDRSLTWFLLITSFYRSCGLILYLGGSLYVWHATSRWVSHPPTTFTTRNSARSQDSQRSPRTPKSTKSTNPVVSSMTSSISKSELSDFVSQGDEQGDEISSPPELVPSVEQRSKMEPSNPVFASKDEVSDVFEPFMRTSEQDSVSSSTSLSENG